MIYGSMRHFPDQDRYEFDGHLVLGPKTKVLLKRKGVAGFELYDRLLGTAKETPHGLMIENEDKIELEVDPAELTYQD